MWSSFGSGDAIKALDAAIGKGGVGTKTKPFCHPQRNVSAFVLHSKWPWKPY